MVERATRDLEKLDAELSRIGLLMQHDSELPSATRLVAGVKVPGSWWGHPLGARIYEVLNEFERGEGALCVKLVDGKLTYVARALWPSFSKLALCDAPPALSPAALTLRQLVEEHGSVRNDRLQLEHIDKRALAAAARELEATLLVHAASVHTKAGHHAKVLSSWLEWSRSSGTTPSNGSTEEARRDLLLALGRLTKGSVREPRVPFLSR